MNNRNNSFDLIRHFAALLVLYSHHYALCKLPEPTFPQWDTLGYVAVVLFFTISGYFMPASYSSSGNFLIFMTKRCRRIFPALIVCSFLMCYLIGTIFTPQPVFDYLLSGSTMKTSLLFSSFIGRPIPGVFSDFLYKDAINGSLWTLPIEFACYLIIGIALYYCNSLKSVLTLFILCITATMFMSHTGMNYMFYGITLSYLSLFGIAFTAGALMSMTQQHWLPIRLHFMGVALLLLFLLREHPEMQILGTLSIAVLTIIIGVSLKDRLINGKFDLSYGIYIYAFPIQQMVINRVTQNFWLSMSISVLFTIFAAYLSYRFVEKPFLYANAYKSKNIQMSSLSVPIVN
ncbi:acyltransferase family protein [Legionella sp.]|uniref:acyltransferase family protein n=1 Tax=Legionella sp. TaxID=459 RepID=UPI003CB7031E